LQAEAVDCHVVFAGPDEGMLPQLRRIAAECGVEDRVHFVGYLGGTAKSQAYHAAELLVVPSRQEAMSIVALEAGISGTPVLLTDQCGFDEVARVGGGMVVPASVEGLREGLNQMLESPSRLKQMGANLQRFVGKHLTWDAAAEKYLTLYSQILKNSGHQG
jgi:glycosyltransferase involved in cell wall biosynthesis